MPRSEYKEKRSRKSSSGEESHSPKSKHRSSKSRRIDERKSDDKEHKRHKHKEHRSRREREEHSRSVKQEDTREEDIERISRSKWDDVKPYTSDDRKPMKQEFGKMEVKDEKPVEKEKVNMGLSGKLAEDTNTYKGVVIKYSQPEEARKPKTRWRWYIFKGEKEIPFLPLHRSSAYLIGRDRLVADIPIDHPSCSKQHAVLQFRLVRYTRDDGTTGRTIKPYIIDLESSNGTYLNKERIEAKRFVELVERDVVNFGFSSRDYVLLHEKSTDPDAPTPTPSPELSPVSILLQK